MVEGYFNFRKKNMNKLKEFFKNNVNYLVFLMVLVVFLKTCKTNGKIENVEKQLKNTDKRVDSLNNNISVLTKNITNEIKIEGLKSEKRMIQSTDRKILDVNRQTEIDKEISKLEK